MRITFISPVGEVGGAERILLGLAERLRSQHQVSVVLMSAGPLQRKLLELGLPTQVVELPGRLRRTGDHQSSYASWLCAAATTPALMVDYVRYVRKLHAVIAATEPEIVHSHGIKAHLAAASAKPRGAKLVWHMHDYLSGRALSRRLLRASSSRADLVVAISRSVAADVSENLPGRPITVIPNFTDLGSFRPDETNRFPLDAVLGLPEAPPGIVRIGLVATYAIWKGHCLFLEAVAQARRTLGPDRIRGYVVGGPIYRTAGRSQISENELRTRIRDLGLAETVGLVPFQPDPAPVYRALDVVVHASTRPEPFGLTIIEAMACGRAVVVAEAGGAAEILTPEQDGLYYQPGDAESLAAALVRLAGDGELCERLGTTARRTVASRYQIETAATALIAAYHAVQSH